jgi:hypothetical protein
MEQSMTASNALNDRYQASVVIIICLLLGGCARTPSVSESEAARLEAVASAWLARGSVDDASAAWPAEIQALKPNAVRVTSQGVYVVTSSSFVEEAGLFVPRDPSAFVPDPGGDPEYKKLYGNVFSYRIRG